MKRALSLFTCYLILFTASAQKPKVDLNTLFVCLDSSTYNALFKNSFIKDTLFFCREQKTQTLADSYNGKYAIGKAATLEFFKPVPSSALGDKFGDLGIEFKTRKITHLHNFIYAAKKRKLAYKIDTSKVQQQEKPLNWYSEFTLKSQVNNTFLISILEYQKEYLLSLGFTEKEITNGMTYEQYNAILAGGKKYPRRFNIINYISLVLNESELTELKNMAGLLGLVQKGLSFVGDHLKIEYKIEKSAKFKVNKIGIKLTENTVTRSVRVSEKLTINTKGDEALLVFNYE